ncbi:HipA domain-containing protein [Leeia sp. TBRC 13508]|uniref:HipA domain-containing protein n=1 Tax=Leeia speluncae TaxID=2884804 RepID=A0ABS8D2Y3_9NEIS|nr:HipA domain-containing protein [Leeia speluncae]MCB6182353.1 HipA domain-containing protein [Leeia speluncae]
MLKSNPLCHDNFQEPSGSQLISFFALNMLNIFSHLPQDGGKWQLVGKLHITLPNSANHLIERHTFSYELPYSHSKYAFPIDPTSLGVKQPPSSEVYFPAHGLLSFGGICDAAPDAWGRRVIETRFNASLNGLPESTYLLAAGGDRIGALDIRASINSPYTPSACPIDKISTLLEIKSIIESEALLPSTFLHLLPSMCGAGGARPKAIIRDEDMCLWLAKFPSANDSHDLVTAEYCAMKLAKACGLNVAEVRREFIGNQPILLVRRFDRFWHHLDESIHTANLYDALQKPGAHEYRIPFISALTLLGCSEFDSPYMSYSHLANAIRQNVHPDFVEADCKELFSRMVYNILINNDDDHLRNHGFLYDFRISGWRLSPVYDVVPRPSFSYERRLHLNIGTEGKVASLENALSCYGDFVKDEEIAIDCIRQLWSKVRLWKSCFSSYGASESTINDVSTAFRPLEVMANKDLVSRIERKK